MDEGLTYAMEAINSYYARGLTNIVEEHDGFKTVATCGTHWLIKAVDIEYLPQQLRADLKHATLKQLAQMGVQYVPPSVGSIATLSKCYKREDQTSSGKSA